MSENNLAFDLSKLKEDVVQGMVDAIKIMDKRSEGFQKAANVSADLIEKYNALEAKYNQLNETTDALQKLYDDNKITYSKSLDLIEKKLATQSFKSLSQNPVNDQQMYLFSGQQKYDSFKELQAYAKCAIDGDTSGASQISANARKRGFDHILENKVIPFYKEAQVVEYSKSGSTYFESQLPTGGYTILPNEYLGVMITRQFETTPMYQLASIQPMSGPTLNLIIDDQLAGDLTIGGELTDFGDQEIPTFGKLQINVNEISGVSYLTHDILEDSRINMLDHLIRKMTERLILTLNDLFLNGEDNIRGLLTYPTWGDTAVTMATRDYTLDGDVPANGQLYQRDRLQNIYSGDATTITLAGLKNLYTSVIDQNMEGAAFMMHRTTWATILGLLDSQNRPLYNILNFMKAPDNRTGGLFGERVFFAANMPYTSDGTFTTGETPIIFGDMKDYMIGERINRDILFDPYTKDNQNLIRIRLRQRTGGALRGFQKIKRMEIGVASPSSAKDRLAGQNKMARNFSRSRAKAAKKRRLN